MVTMNKKKGPKNPREPKKKKEMNKFETNSDSHWVIKNGWGIKIDRKHLLEMGATMRTLNDFEQEKKNAIFEYRIGFYGIFFNNSSHDLLTIFFFFL